MKKHGFGRQQRLSSPRQFRAVFEKQNKVVSRYFIVLCRGNQLEKARLGISVAKKHIRFAVDRNKIKRIIRESFRHNQPYLKGGDFVVVVRGSALQCIKNELRYELDEQWKKTRIS